MLRAMRARLNAMARDQEELTAHVRKLDSKYQSLLGEMVNF